MATSCNPLAGIEVFHTNMRKRRYTPKPQPAREL